MAEPLPSTRVLKTAETRWRVKSATRLDLEKKKPQAKLPLPAAPEGLLT
jgi:hypothetical protein